MGYLRSLLARLRAWRQAKQETVHFDESLMSPFMAAIQRDVTPSGVRFYSVCGGCGTRLECSATLCEECAQGPHTSMF